MHAGGTGDDERLSPEASFAVLGDETRLGILQALGSAAEPLSFSALFDRVDYETTANFSYHLDQLVGHFVEGTDDGYVLKRAGSRVIEAVLSGAVTESPVVERTRLEEPCFRCGGPMELDYREEDVGLYCADCGGTRGGRSDTADWADDAEADILGHLRLPPAGVRDRSPREILRAAEVWTVMETQALARDVCPRCSATVDHTVTVCEDHHLEDGRCPACDQWFATIIRFTCRNCLFDLDAIFTARLLTEPALMAFMMAHGIDPMAPAGFHVSNLVREAVRSTDPFEAAFTFRAGDETLTLTVDDDLGVVDSTVEPASAAPARADD